MEPFIISSIILSIAFFIVLVLNQEFKSKIIKYCFLFFILVFLILIILFDNNFIYEFLKAIITYMWYPNYVLFVISILASLIILLYTLLKKVSIINKIVNYILFCIAFSCYNIYLSFKFDPLLYSSLYEKNSLIIMRIATISFLIWIVFNLILKGRRNHE